MADDPYVYPGTEVLRNKLDLRDPAELAAAEADLTFYRALQLADEPIVGSYDLAHLQRFHAHLFGDVYDWAGEIRTVAIAKSEMFALPQFVASYASEALGRLARDGHLRELDRTELVGKLAGYLGDVNAAHPFREGNGRTQRAFFGQLASNAGYTIAWDRIDPDRNIKASIAAMRGVQRPLRELLDKITSQAGERAPTDVQHDLADANDHRAKPVRERDTDRPDKGSTSLESARRGLYDENLQRADERIGKLEAENGGPLSDRQRDAIEKARRQERQPRARTQPSRQRERQDYRQMQLKPRGRGIDL